MIFSKDKKPTEPGWYWCIEDDAEHPDNVPYPTFVWRTKIGTLRSSRGFSLREDGRLFGDRIGIPTVEAP